MSISNIKNSYKERVFEENKNIIPKDDFPWFYLKNYLNDDRSIKILDAGCGSGKYCDKLISIGYKNVYGIDLLGEKSFKHKVFSYFQGSIDSTPFNDNEFDLIFANSVIYHLNNPNAGIIELKRILKPTGILIITGHTKYSLFTLWRRIQLILNIKSVKNLEKVKFRPVKYYVNLLKQNKLQIKVQDGYFLSFFLYPFYRRKAVGLINSGWKLPLLNPKFSKIPFFAKIKSEIAYHFVIISRKDE